MGQTLPLGCVDCSGSAISSKWGFIQTRDAKMWKNTLENVCIGGTGRGTCELFSSFKAVLTITCSRRTDAQGADPLGHSRKSGGEEGRATQRPWETSCLLTFAPQLCCQFKPPVSLDPRNVRGQIRADSFNVVETLNQCGARAFTLVWVMLGDIFKIKDHNEAGCLANN